MCFKPAGHLFPQLVFTFKIPKIALTFRDSVGRTGLSVQLSSQ